MAIVISELNGGKILDIVLSGKLSKEDYEIFGPEIERLIGIHGKLRILVSMVDFHGWELGALWEDIKFDAKHFSDIERLALVGDSKWEKGMATFCKPFTKAEVKFFPTAERTAAEAWLRE
ncbi:STAS/SEC14 domain-containing protein [soil metagenome]